MLANSQKLDRLIAFTDYNKMQIDGSIEEVNGLYPLDDKWKSFGWHVQVITAIILKLFNVRSLLQKTCVEDLHDYYGYNLKVKVHIFVKMSILT